MRYRFTLGSRNHHVTLEEHADGPIFMVDGAKFQPQVKRLSKGEYEVELDGQTHRFSIRDGHVAHDGEPIEVEVRRAKPELVRAGGKGRKADGKVKPPMPGKVVSVNVAVGDEVQEGEILVVLEAMKMQNDLKSPIGGTVSKIHVKDGQNVEATTVLLEIEPPNVPEA